jgi:DNA-binding MarR family transcriptional regulator
MLRAGLVERILDPDGGLARKLRITGSGLARLRSDRDWAVGGIGRILADWDPADVQALATLLAQFNTTIERRQGRLWPRPVADRG